jgi:hypothetical protein
MTKEEIYERARGVIGLEGMTGNERLWTSGLMEEFDRVKKTDKLLAQTILKALKFDELSIIRIVGNSMETLKHPNPWDFPNENSNRLENENKAVIEYSNLTEVGMGAPIGGPCELKRNGLDKVLIDNWCGGPAIWNENGLKLAIPIWDSSFFKGKFQRIGLVDLEKLTLSKFKKTYKVLDLRTFNGKLIKGFDSPIHKTIMVEFDIEKEQIEQIIKIK